jgi:methyl-accepting chemotaxis protein
MPELGSPRFPRKAATLRNLSIRARVFGGFGIVLALLAVLAFIAHRALVVIDAEANSLSKASEQLGAVNDFALRLGETHHLVSQAALTEAAPDRDAARTALGRLAAAFGEMRVHTTGEAASAAMAKIDAAQAAYASAVTLMIEAIDRRQASTEMLEKSATALKTTVSAIVATLIRENRAEQLPVGLRLQDAVQASAAAATRFLSSRNPADSLMALNELKGMRAQREQLDKTAADSARLRRFLGALPEPAQQFGEGIEGVVAATEQFRKAGTERDKATAEIDGLASRLRRDSQQLQRGSAQSLADIVGSLGTTNLTIAGGALVAGLLLAWLIGHGITAPVGRLTAVMKTLAAGTIDCEIGDQDRGDEIGEMARAVGVFKTNAVEVRSLHAEQEAVKKLAEAERHAAMLGMAGEFERSVTRVVEGVATGAGTVRRTAESMSSVAEETTRQSTAAASASERTATNVETVATAAEELTASINEIGRQVGQSLEIAGRAVAEADATNTTVRSLAEAAHKIGDVVELIQAIAGQTNLLALNATIEAARAGEAGKGFAVVASEVKALAGQTAKATEEIGRQITAIQDATKSAVQAIGDIGATVRAVNDVATTIAAAVEEQLAATQEIARNVHEASTGTTAVSANIAGVSETAGESGRNAAAVLTAANDLNAQSTALQHTVETFLNGLRAA